MRYLVLTLFILLISMQTHANNFEAEGSDLLMGVGAKNIAKAGAVTAGTDDIYSIFWNPAGLSEIDNYEISLSSQANYKISPANFLGAAYVTKFQELNLKLALAFALIPRVYIKSSGLFKENEFETIFIKYALPNVQGDFNADIISKTDDFRFAAAISPIYNKSWSLGFAIGYVNCTTTFGGITLEDPSNYKSISTLATTISYNMGAKYYVNDKLTLATNLKNIDSMLTVKIHQIDDNGETDLSLETNVPYDLTIGADYKVNKDIDLAMDYQYVFGSYGHTYITYKVLRFGATLSDDNINYHFGLMAMQEVNSPEFEDVDPPFPVAPTAGIGWHTGNIDLSFAFYFHPIMSLYKGKASPASDLSISYSF